MITRIAPTPSGFIHTGNIYNFLLNWLYARINNGKVLLRVDDLDQERVRQEYLDDLFFCLEMFGLDWDIGPESIQDLKSDWSQLSRMHLYDALINTLTEKNATYACNCSRKSLEDKGIKNHYPGICRNKNLSYKVGNTSLRVNTHRMFCSEQVFFRVSEENDQPDVYDFIIRRRDGLPAYHIASVCDDLHFKVTHVFRGMDLQESTCHQQILAGLSGQQEFSKIVFYHHHLLVNDDGEKLSKSAGSGVSSPWRNNKEKVVSVLSGFAEWAGINLKNNLLINSQELLNYIKSEETCFF